MREKRVLAHAAPKRCWAAVCVVLLGGGLMAAQAEAQTPPTTAPTKKAKKNRLRAKAATQTPEAPTEPLTETPLVATETLTETQDSPLALTPPPLPEKESFELSAKQPMSPMRLTSYGLLGSAGAAAIVGTVFAVLANANFKKYKKGYVRDGDLRVLIPSDENLQRHKGDMRAAIHEGAQLRQRVSTQKTLAIVAFSAAGAAAAAGLTLFFLSPERHVKQNLKLGLAPTDGGAMLSLQGVLP